MQPFDYGRATRECDIVMKGGITSGVVYPLAICELAQSFRFRSVGGTSAGAIAAAFTAAAEYGRRHGTGDGFKVLERLPAWIGRDGHLLGLFQPIRRARPVFHLLTATLGEPRGRSRRMLSAAVEQFGRYTFPALIPPFALVPALMVLDGLGWWVTALAALLLLLTGFGVALAIAVVFSGRAALEGNGYGLCSGMPEDGSAQPALTPWMMEQIDTAAGIPHDRHPLTFRDLWNTQGSTGQPDIDLRMVTTCLTLARPFTIPMEQWRPFYFAEAEWRALFPARVVDWIVRRSNEEVASGRRRAPPAGYHVFPEPGDLPVVVAARMSLSFPLLISAVPLYSMDYILGEKGPGLERVWFSDGGICSNFPVHFFDSPLPTRPTVAITLSPFHIAIPRDLADESRNVWMVPDNAGGVLPIWNRFDSEVADGTVRPTPSLGGFLGAIVSTMQNWVDTSQTRAPGFRDRIAHVHLDEKLEGGLNLTMPEEIIDRLAQRGYYAGATLRQRFTDSSTEMPMNWRNHRWVRLRSTLAATQEWLQVFGQRFGAETSGGDPSYSDMLSGVAGAPPSYPFPRTMESVKLLQAVAQLNDAITDWEKKQIDFTTERPRPKPKLRLSLEL